MPKTFIDRFVEKSDAFTSELLNSTPEIRSVVITVDWNLPPAMAESLPNGVTASRLQGLAAGLSYLKATAGMARVIAASHEKEYHNAVNLAKAEPSVASAPDKQAGSDVPGHDVREAAGPA